MLNIYIYTFRYAIGSWYRHRYGARCERATSFSFDVHIEQTVFHKPESAKQREMCASPSPSLHRFSVAIYFGCIFREGCLLAPMYWANFRLCLLLVSLHIQCTSNFVIALSISLYLNVCIHVLTPRKGCMVSFCTYSLVTPTISISVATEPLSFNFVVYIWERTIKMQYRTVLMLTLKIYITLVHLCKGFACLCEWMWVCVFALAVTAI